MSSTAESQMKTGKVTGTGSQIKVEFTDFTPRKVVLRNVDSADELVWMDTMPDDYGWKTLAAGTSSYVTSGGVTPVYQQVLGDGQDPGRGFLIGTDTDINVTDEVIHWEAWA